MVRKTKEEALITRNLLLDTAEHLFCTRGVAGTSLHEIAEAAGLTRGAVYWHFENKGDLLTALWERVAGPLREAFDRETGDQGSDDPLQRIRLKANFKSRQIETNSRLRTVMTILMLRCEFSEDTTSSASAYFLREREYAYECLHQEFERALALGQLPATVNTEQAVIGLFGLIDGLCFHWLINPARFPITSTCQQAIDAYLKGLANLPTPP
jgi:TetR/AcrR family transcriptional regulator, acrAB operon repressor